MKSLDILAKEWFDKINGNSYFSAQIILDYSLPTEKTIYLPFQYGYDEQFIYEAKKELDKLNLLEGILGKDTALWNLRDRGIVFRYSKKTKCLKKEVITYGKK